MAHLFQVGAGSGGMAALDLLAHDDRITRVTLVEPDDYRPHNVVRHLFPSSGVGRLKADLARDWLRERRPDLAVDLLPCDLTDPAIQGTLDEIVEAADLAVCAADNERAKFHFDALMRRHRKPWTLGEVLSGGIGGLVHTFVPGGPCYGCVATFFRRAVPADGSPAPDYAHPDGPLWETSVPAGIAAIHAIASLHALATLQLLTGEAPPFTSLLMPLACVAGVFDEAYRPRRFGIARDPGCLTCNPTPIPAEALDVALDQALARLADA